MSQERKLRSGHPASIWALRGYGGRLCGWNHPGHLDLHRISKCVIWKGTRCDNFVFVWLQSWPESSQDPPPLFQIMLYIWQWPPTLFTCTCSLWMRRICRPICTVSLSQKSAILERTKEQTAYTVKCWSSIVKEQINWETLINEFDETLFAENASSETQRQCRRGPRTTERRYWLMPKDFVKILFPSYTDTQYPRRTHSLTAIFTAAELQQGIFASCNHDYWLSKCM